MTQKHSKSDDRVVLCAKTLMFKADLNGDLGNAHFIRASEPLALKPDQKVQVKRDLLLDPDGSLVGVVITNHVSSVWVEEHFELSVVGGHPRDGLSNQFIWKIDTPLA